MPSVNLSILDKQSLMDKQKIAIIGVKYWPSRGGVSRIVEDTVELLKDYFEFTIYCYAHPMAATHMSGVNVIQIEEKKMGVVGVFNFYRECVNHAVRFGDYDLVHLHKIDAAYFLPALTQRYQVIATSHESPYKRDKWSAITKQYFRAMERRFMNADATLTSISKPLAEYYEKAYGRKVTYIPNGVDVHLSPNEADARTILNKHDVKEPFIFFAARRVMSTKGAHHLLDALKRLDYRGNVVIAGDTRQVPAYTRRLLEQAQGLNVHFIGYVAEKATLMALVQLAEVFVFPSEVEGMSVMLLEVASLGTPVIASDIEENTSVFDESELLFFRSQDEADLAQKLAWSFRHSKEMQQMAVRARRRVQTEYNRELISQRYAMLYRQGHPVMAR